MTRKNSKNSSALHAVALNATGFLLRTSGLLSRTLRKPATHLLYLHHIPDTAWFDQFVAGIRKNFELIDHDQAVQRIRCGQHPGPAVSFSFDDGFSSCADALRILEKHNTRGIVFVCTGLVGLDDKGVARFFGNRQREGVLGWPALRELQAAGHLIGSHTETHANLAELDDHQLHVELETSRNRIIAELGTCDHFAWPYGRRMFVSERALKLARDAGYRSIASGIRGSHTGPSGGILLRQLVDAGQTVNQTRLFMAMGMLGIDKHSRSRRWAQSTNISDNHRELPGAADAR